MNRRLIFFIGVYDTLDIFAFELQREFEGMGYETMLFDTADLQKSLVQLAAFVKKPVTAVITFNNLGYNMELTQGNNIWNDLDLFVVNILMDHPFCYKPALDASPRKAAVLCPDRNHMRYIQRFYPQIPVSGYLPHAGIAPYALTLLLQIHKIHGIIKKGDFMDTNDLVKLLPSGYEQACFDKKAITRKRTIKNPLDLLRLILFYLSGNKSFIDVSQFALISGIGKISDVGFMKRFIKCKEWIIWLTQHILPNPVIQYQKPGWLEPFQVLAIDASDIAEKGAVKRLWHLHYAVDLFSLTCSQFKITGQSTGESLKNFTLAKGCLVIADRAYGTIKSMEHCLAAGGDFIIRIKNKAFNIYDADGGKLVFTDWLRTVSETAEELNVYIRNSEKKLVPLRICACKKTKAEIAAEKVRIKKMESKKQKKLSDETVFTHNYMFVITSLPAEISAAEILSCYRLRWQVELVFKRLKSLLQLGSIPTKTEEASEAWINGKILLSLLTEKYLGDVDFSPSWNIRSQSECMEGDEAGILYNFYDDTAKYPDGNL